MGSKMTPSYAVIFMADLERKMLVGYLFTRCIFIDTLNFFIWRHGLPSLHSLVSFCNAFHPSIKFTKEIPFLDVLVKLHYDSGSIATTLYCKPTYTIE
ncbi:hypothetical protein HOLleu_24132 [Holothuria leucospilota]|uniref:Uncharacterized protein n=1 Tax=Holothuria leucospilota TaxID=206669 RepID=A0A9Q1BVT5_HOLLE|nr:hypothetical protein HOLleu_24132 [Holothuria leucospilota]